MSDLKDGARILDVGCGTGSLSGKLTDARSLRVFGLDMDVQLLCISRDNGLLPTAGSFDAAFPYVEETFDVVLMIDTIEHIQSRERTLCSVKRVLQSDGLFVVFTPRYDSLSWTIGESIFKVITRRAAHHITPFTVESLTWLFRNNFLEWRVGTTNFGLTLYAVGRYKI
jgi:2-polyprenyl-3-methyl-5-hydroxy-6-metoxy-1,4-benzoquinol methylase